MSDTKIGALVELDFCVGCYACQSACQDTNELSVKETYLRCIVAKPERVNGEMHCFMGPIPYDLAHCANCIEREGGQAPCEKICIGKALHFGPVADVRRRSETADGRTMLFA